MKYKYYCFTCEHETNDEYNNCGCHSELERHTLCKRKNENHKGKQKVYTENELVEEWS